MSTEIRASSLPSGGAVSAEYPSWFAIHTRARHEKTVAAHLEQRGVTSFLPLVSETHAWSDRQKVVSRPLFSCYTFVHMAQYSQLRKTVLQTPGVLGFVGINGAGVSIPDEEIEAIQTLIGSDAQLEPRPYLTIGQRVRIVGGSFDGVEGILEAKNSDRSLVVSVALLQRSVAVRVDGYRLETL